MCMLSILKVLSSIPSTQHPQNNGRIQINIKYTPFIPFSFIFPPISFFHPLTPPFLFFSISHGGHRELLGLYDQVQTCSMLDMAILDGSLHPLTPGSAKHPCKRGKGGLTGGCGWSQRSRCIPQVQSGCVSAFLQMRGVYSRNTCSIHEYPHGCPTPRPSPMLYLQ